MSNLPQHIELPPRRDNRGTPRLLDNGSTPPAALHYGARSRTAENDFMELDTTAKREVGHLAVWSLSSCKPGFGVEQLRDNCLDTYWQSDGPQPHLVNIQFRCKTTITDVQLYADYKLDESYTPEKISIRAGNHFHDLHEIETVELTEPSGWVNIALRDKNRKPIRAFLIQIAILSNHQNGRDTHLRQIKINSPVQETMVTALDFTPRFSTRAFFEHAYIR